MRTFLRNLPEFKNEVSLHETEQGLVVVLNKDPYVTGSGETLEEAVGDMFINHTRVLFGLIKAGVISVEAGK